MEIFERLAEHNHEQVVFCYEPSTGYKGIIAIHNTTLGPALGGTRFWNYAATRRPSSTCCGWPAA
jgi:leucine dehydrogenase